MFQVAEYCYIVIVMLIWEWPGSPYLCGHGTPGTRSVPGQGGHSHDILEFANIRLCVCGIKIVYSEIEACKLIIPSYVGLSPNYPLSYDIFGFMTIF